MTGETFEGLLKWVLETDSRTMEVDVGRLLFGKREISAYVYDYELSMGQRVCSVDQINLKQAKEVSLRRLQKALGD